jgi:hypothetical protein
MPISYSTKENKRAVGAEQSIVAEMHVIGTVGAGTTQADYIKLIESPLQEIPSSITIPGFLETTVSPPGVTEFFVDYISGHILFHTSQNGNTVSVTYKGRGSKVDALDVNELQGPLGSIANFDGTLTNGIVKPLSISTNPADNFSFPNDVIVVGNLTVQGTTTTFDTQTVLIEDNILLLNSNVTGAPTLDSGFEVERGSSPNVQLVWDESLDAWKFKDTSNNAILTAFDTGDVSIGASSADARLHVAQTGVSTHLILEDPIAGSNTPGLEFRGTGSTLGRLQATNLISSGIRRNFIFQSTSFTDLVTISETDGGKLGIGVATPAASFHNFGSTLLGLTSSTNPGSISVASVDEFSGIVITTSSPVSVTLPAPTNTTQGRVFSVLHNDTSTSTLSVNTNSITVGKGATFIWDGTAWILVASSSGGGSSSFVVVASDPGSPAAGDVWFNSTDSQFKGYTGTSIVILG